MTWTLWRLEAETVRDFLVVTWQGWLESESEVVVGVEKMREVWCLSEMEVSDDIIAAMRRRDCVCVLSVEMEEVLVEVFGIRSGASGFGFWNLVEEIQTSYFKGLKDKKYLPRLAQVVGLDPQRFNLSSKHPPVMTEVLIGKWSNLFS